MQRPWTVGSHDSIERLEDNLWSVAGAVPGMALRRRMSIVRLTDGRLVIHSCFPLREPEQREVEAWGEPAFIVVPSGYHRLDAPAYKTRYPKAKVLCAPEAVERVSRVVAVDGDFTALPSDPALRGEPVRGVRLGEHVFFVKSSPGAGRVTLILNDVVFNHPHVPGFGGFLLRMVGSTGGPRVTRVARTMLVSDRSALRAHLEQLADTAGLTRLVVSHVDPITDSPATVLRQVAGTL